MGGTQSRILVIGAVTVVALLKVPAFGEKIAAKQTATAKVAQRPAAAPPKTEQPTPQVAIPAQTKAQEAKPPEELAAKKPTLFGHTTYPEAWTASQQSNRPILLYVSMSGCHHCDKMMAESYRTPEMEELLVDSFETLYVTRQHHPKLVKKLKVKWYPTTVLVGSNNKIMDVIEGYVDRKSFKRRIQTSLASTPKPVQTR